jgi:hypothetical protein
MKVVRTAGKYPHSALDELDEMLDWRNGLLWTYPNSDLGYAEVVRKLCLPSSSDLANPAEIKRPHLHMGLNLWRRTPTRDFDGKGSFEKAFGLGQLSIRKDVGVTADGFELTEGRLLFSSDTHYLGLSPKQTEPGDEVCFLFGAKVPFIVRRQENGHYHLVGGK